MKKNYQEKLFKYNHHITKELNVEDVYNIYYDLHAKPKLEHKLQAEMAKKILEQKWTETPEQLMTYGIELYAESLRPGKFQKMYKNMYKEYSKEFMPIKKKK